MDATAERQPLTASPAFTRWRSRLRLRWCWSRRWPVLWLAPRRAQRRAQRPAAGVGGGLAIAALLSTLLFAPPPGAAEPRRSEPPEELRLAPIEVEDELPPGEEQPRSPSAFVTVVSPKGASEEVSSVAEVLAEGVGVQVRSLGGLGSFSSISIRGSTAAQVAVFLDGVPLNLGSTGAVNLADLPLEQLSHIEVFRGSAPAELGGQVIGGAVNLVTRAGGETASGVSASYGSFGTRKLTVRRQSGSSSGGGLDYALVAVYQGSQGDFTYFDDHETPYNPTDDAFVVRRNNRFDQGNLLLRLGHALAGGGHMSASLDLLSRQQGIPGTGSLQTSQTSLGTFRALAAVRLTMPRLLSDALDGQLGAHLLVEWQRFADPLGEIGLGAQDGRYLTVAGGAQGRLGLSLGRHQLLALVPELRVEQFRQSDPLSALDQDGTAVRVAAAFSLRDEIGLLGERLLLTPTLRVDLTSTRYVPAAASDPAGSAGSPVADPPPSSFDVFLSPRLGVRGQVMPELSLRANFGRYYRAPTFFELYGDRGAFVGNPGLRSESGISGDVGVVLERPRRLGPLDRLYFEAAFFFSQAEDLIQFVQTSQRTLTAQNFSQARSLGLELAATLRLFSILSLRLNYTFLRAINLSPSPAQNGLQLPGRPRHDFFGRVELEHHLGPLAGLVYYETQLTAETFLDAVGARPVPRRLLQAVGLRLRPRWRWLRGFSLGFDCKNVANVRIEEMPVDQPGSGTLMVPRAVVDVFGYPLPGRAFFGTLDYRF